MGTVCAVAARPAVADATLRAMLLPGDVTVRELRPAETVTAVDIFADAFLDFPALQVMAGTDADARDRLKRLFAMEFEPDSGAMALAAEVDGRLVGALTYMDTPVCSTMSAGRIVRFIRIAGPRIIRTMRMFGRIERVHPRRPHRHLPTIGVSPPFQAQGVGRALMEAFDQGCDQDGIEAYLETIRWADPGRPSHERFYGRLGFVVADTVPMTDEWEVLTMTRAARGSTG